MMESLSAATNCGSGGQPQLPPLIIPQQQQIIPQVVHSDMTLGEEGSYNEYAKSDLFDPEEFVSSGSSSSDGGGGGGQFHDDLVGDEEDSNSGGGGSDDEEEEEEEDLDFLDEDEGSESEGGGGLLFDHLFLKFRSILDGQVEDAERFFDRGLLRPPNTTDVASQTEELPSTPHDPLFLPVNQSSSFPPNNNRSSQKGVETQTDDASASALLSSTNSAQMREEPHCARAEIGKLRDAREPLNQERKSMAERLKALKKVGGGGGGGGSSSHPSVRWEEKQMYELEEAIEAIDLAIEFKNEIICGHEAILSDKMAPGQERAELVTRLASLSVFDLQRLFCKFFVKVVEFRYCTKRLERNVDKLEGEREQMRRIISIYKKSLREKDEEHENRIKLLLRQCAKGGQSGGGGGGGGDILWMTQELSKAKRKLLDFQHALTELLVRHGYLIDGADFDVKHVVRMLGLDFGELKQLEAASAGSGSNYHTHTHHHPSSSSHHHPHRRNLNQRRNAEPENAVPFHLHSAPSSSSRRQQQQQQPSSSSSSHQAEAYAHHGHGSSGTSSNHQQRQSHHHPPSSSSSRHNNNYAPQYEGYRDRGGGHRERSRETKDRERDYYRHNNRSHHHNQGQVQSGQQNHQNNEPSSLQHGGTEVKRLKKKLIIQQPNTSQ